jgi:methylthioribose-1-phosphate isomerase
MLVDGKPVRPIWLDANTDTVQVIDQRQLPHRFVVADLTTVDAVIHAIREMFVRGAPLIGVTGAYGVMVAAKQAAAAADNGDAIRQACDRLKAARPTAVNLAWGVDRVYEKV